MSLHRKIDAAIASARAIRKTFEIAGLLDQGTGADLGALPSSNRRKMTDSSRQKKRDMGPESGASDVKRPTTADGVAGTVKVGSETPVTSKVGVRRPIAQPLTLVSRLGCLSKHRCALRMIGH